jgi:hypothetical protein
MQAPLLRSHQTLGAFFKATYDEPKMVELRSCVQIDRLRKPPVPLRVHPMQASIKISDHDASLRTAHSIHFSRSLSGNRQRNAPRLFALICWGLLVAALCFSETVEAQQPALAGPPSPKGKVFHVSPTGIDTNPGATAGLPLRTIQSAAKRMKPGDTCLIHGGVYRESLVPPADGTSDAPILFQAAPGEVVTLSGLDPVTGWERVNAQTFRAPLDWDLGAGNQVFRENNPLTEARWPNRRGLDAFAPEGARAAFEGSAFDRLHCAEFPDGWTPEMLAGATVWCMAQWRWSSWTAPVTRYDPATRTLLLKGHNNWWVKEKHNPGTKPPKRKGKDIYEPAQFFLSNARSLLDAPGEWFFDTAEKRLYLAVAEGEDPNRFSIHVKRRPVAVDLSNRAHVQVRGLRIVGATVLLKESRNCLVAGVNARHICHTRGGFSTASVAGSEGVLISGTGNVLRDSEIAFSAGAGVTLTGTGNAIINCFIHDTDTLGSYDCSVKLGGSGHLVSHNTLRDSGRDCLKFAGTAHQIQYNDVSGAGRICHDTGAIYQGGMDGAGTEISYNWVHDVNTGYGNGIYLDNYTSNYLIHHNVVWGVSGNAVQLNQPSHYNRVFHNTLFGSLRALYSPWKGQRTMFGSLLANNLVQAPSEMKPGYTEVASVLHALPSPQAGFDPSRDVSEAGIDKGLVLPGINDGFSGASPDCGAYETGKPLWRAGHDFAQRPSPVYALAPSLHRNYLTNGSFTHAEEGAPLGWRVVAGKAAVHYHSGFNDPPADARFSVHGNSLALDGETEAKVSQTVGALPKETEFVFAAYVRSEGAKDISLRVRTPQGEIGSALYSATEAAVWRHVEVRFRATALPLTLVITKEGAGTAYIDDAGVIPVWKEAGN